ncbi:hypothetical protein [Paenibacillus polymyxa]|uniref:hypothetical protein n=1 Tax=Paenibacillus polymyxa TaxID=1406 RepID=UPI0025B671AD|nr:hypothetical protein [Paenibacillus polymyxa]MDN4086028.1 hypothetical protein [Paenibacillus polymyxa]MDN4108349.1 hypothetical protein [Paenibacillus polymyxa]
MNKKKFFLSLFIVLIILVVLQVPNYIRYQFDKNFGDPHTFFYDVGIGVLLDETNNYYEEEIDLDDQNKISIDVSQYKKRKADLYIYGRYINSAEPLVVVLNDIVIYNDKPENESVDFYSRYYFKKYFVVKLSEAVKKGENKLVISTGNATKNYDLYIN